MDRNAPTFEAIESVQAAAEQQLIARAIQGDVPALDQLLVHYYQRPCDHIACKVPTWLQRVIEVDDVAQDTVKQVIQSVEKFQPRGRGGFFAWLTTIADNLVIDRLRRIGLEPTAASVTWLDGLSRLLSTINPTPSRQAAQREAVEAMQAAMARLPPRQQTAIVLQYVERKTIKEIASAMECTDHAVRGLLHHAKENLRRAMGRTSKWLTKN